MSDQQQPPANILHSSDPVEYKYDRAVVKPVRHISKIWLIPLLALGIGMWMIYYQWSNQGPLITIAFPIATGLEAGKTKIKTRNVDIGLVKKVELSEDLTGVTVTARMNGNIEPLLRKDSQFWIVSPRVSLNGVSGLSTLVSGPFINMAPGTVFETSDKFVALEAPPVTPAGTPGLHITLNSDAEFAYKEGDPVIYKGLKVGEIENTHFNFDERMVYYNTFITAPYHKLITENTKFWDTSGVKIQLTAQGIKIDTGSIESLLTNGVTFGIPEGSPAGQQVTKRSFFDIYRSYEQASEQRYKLSAEFVIFVKDTVRGLHIGAPVEYRGLEVGKVLGINPPHIKPPQTSVLEEGYDIPVIISVQPGRVQQPDNQQGLAFVRSQIIGWIDKGLRASLKTGNLLTGALFVDLQHYPDAVDVDNIKVFDFDVIPTVSSEFAQLSAKLSAVLDNVNQIQFKQLSDNTADMLSRLSKAAESIQVTSEQASQFVDDIEIKQLQQQLSTTLSSVNRLLNDFSADSESYQELNRTMRSIQQSINTLQPLFQQLNQQPNSLIFTEQRGPVLEPKAKASRGKKDASAQHD
ncbi:MAG: intermembrane transport protein PqiB [Paraglaciecola sp.]|nr:intermembrane transport protein PqiB [Paraglaciecola sp.]NCT48325.1 intermembrane transport protein PqiB [Paraglaciecola sp.]